MGYIYVCVAERGSRLDQFQARCHISYHDTNGEFALQVAKLNTVSPFPIDGVVVAKASKEEYAAFMQKVDFARIHGGWYSRCLPIEDAIEKWEAASIQGRIVSQDPGPNPVKPRKRRGPKIDPLDAEIDAILARREQAYANYGGDAPATVREPAAADEFLPEDDDLPT